MWIQTGINAYHVFQFYVSDATLGPLQVIGLCNVIAYEYVYVTFNGWGILGN